MKKLSLLFLLLAGSLFADPDPKNADQSLALFRKKPAIQKPEPFNPDNVSAPMERSITVSLDFLYWNASIPAYSPIQYRTIDSSQIGGTVTQKHLSKAENPKKLWRPGFRVGIGNNFEKVHWDTHLLWTYFYSKRIKNREAVVPLISGQQGQEGFNPIYWISNPVQGNYQAYQAYWRLNYNTVDLELGRPIAFQAFTFRPFWGFRLGWVHNHFNTLLTGNKGTQNISDIMFEGTNDYWGLGPRAGVDSDWYVAKGFSLVGGVSLSMLYGDIDSRQKAIDVERGGDLTEVESFEDEFKQLVPVLQGALGVKWGTSMAAAKNRIYISVLWESTYWWGQLHLPRTMFGTSNLMDAPSKINQPLSLQGVTGNLSFDF